MRILSDCASFPSRWSNPSIIDAIRCPVLPLVTPVPVMARRLGTGELERHCFIDHDLIVADFVIKKVAVWRMDGGELIYAIERRNSSGLSRPLTEKKGAALSFFSSSYVSRRTVER